ncbi:hypothetical protein FQZ97_837790 [compost metagenome]
MARPAGAALGLAPGRARPAAGAARWQPAAGQRARLGPAGVQRAAGFPARHQPPPAGRRAGPALAGHLVVRRKRGAARSAAPAQGQRDQAHLPKLGAGNGHGPVPGPARTQRVVGPHGTPPRRLHRAVLDAAVADAHLVGRAADAALGHAARVRAGRRPAVLARAARRPGAAGAARPAHGFHAAWRQQRRLLGADRRPGRSHQPAAVRAEHAGAGAPETPGDQPRR